MTIKKFAEQYRLKIRCDECGDSIIPGRRGHLYFNGPELCLMVTNGTRVLRSRWEMLGGKLWMGDISDGVQDVKVTGIPLENARLAIRMVGCKPKRMMSEAQKAALAKAQKSSPLHAQMQRHAVESFGRPIPDLKHRG